jgi:outer membrane protein assembly factor BamB
LIGLATTPWLGCAPPKHQVKAPSHDTPPPVSFERAWDQPIVGEGSLSLTSNATTLFIAAFDDSLEARSAADGHVLWSVPFSPETRPLICGSGVCVVADGALRALDAATGSERWFVPTPASPVELAARGARVVVSASTGIAAFRAADGSPVWQRAMGASTTVPPVIDQGQVFAALADGRLVGLDLENGETKWSARLVSAPAGLLAENGLLYFGALDGKLNAYAQDSGAFKWAYALGSEPVDSPVTDGRRVYVASRDHSVWAVDARNGNLRWRAQVPARPAFSPWLDETAVLVALVTGEVDILNVRSGQSAGTVAAPEPATAGFIDFPARLQAVTSAERGRFVRLTLDRDQRKSTLASFTLVKPPPKDPGKGAAPGRSPRQSPPRAD